MGNVTFLMLWIALSIITTQATTNAPRKKDSSRYIHAVHPLVAEGTVTTQEDPLAVQALVPPIPSGALQDTSIFARARGSRGLIRTLEDICFEILGIPDKHRKIARELHQVDTQYTKCTGRCAGILGGFYTDENGVNVEALFRKVPELNGNQALMEQIVTEKKRCLDSIPERPKDVPVDVCDRMYNVFLCIQDLYEMVMTVR